MSLEDDDNDSAAKAFAWDSLSMSKKKRCLSTRSITWVQSQHLRALNPWQMDDTLWKEGVYHRESDVNSG